MGTAREGNADQDDSNSLEGGKDQEEQKSGEPSDQRPAGHNGKDMIVHLGILRAAFEEADRKWKMRKK